MKLLPLIAIGLLFLGKFSLASSTSEEWNEVSTPGWISSPEKSWAKPNLSCDLYRSYWVISVEKPDQVGSDIFIFKKGSHSKFPRDCNADRSKAWLAYNDKDNDNGRTAIHGDVLFLDAGTDNWRGLSIISLKNKKKITSMGYGGSASSFSIEGNFMVYEGQLHPGQDGDFRTWKIVRKCTWGPEHMPKGHFQENYSGTCKVNLNTGEQTVSDVTCEIGQAAG